MLLYINFHDITCMSALFHLMASAKSIYNLPKNVESIL